MDLRIRWRGVLRWSAPAYLARVVADAPVNALQAARSIPATENPFVHLDLVAVAAVVPRHVVAGLSRRRRAILIW
jgi:hypothetical protein